MTDQELKDFIANLAISIQDLKASQAETDRQMKASRKEADRRLKELGKQIGGLGNKFGSFTEGFMYPSLHRILRKQFGMEVVVQRMDAGKGDDNIELDVFGYANGKHNTAMVVEVKSHLTEEGIKQLLDNLSKVPQALPDHARKRLYGMIAFVDAPKDVVKRAQQLGIYLARVSDETVSLEKPKGFKPTDFSKQAA